MIAAGTDLGGTGGKDRGGRGGVQAFTAGGAELGAVGQGVVAVGTPALVDFVGKGIYLCAQTDH